MPNRSSILTDDNEDIEPVLCVCVACAKKVLFIMICPRPPSVFIHSGRRRESGTVETGTQLSVFMYTIHHLCNNEGNPVTVLSP